MPPKADALFRKSLRFMAGLALLIQYLLQRKSNGRAGAGSSVQGAGQ